MKISQFIVTGLLFTVAIVNSPPSISQDTEMAQALKAIEDALPGSLMHNPLALDWETTGQKAKMKVVDADGPPTGKALSAKVSKKAKNPWDVAVRTQIEDGITPGDTIKAYFWARTKKAPKGMETADITLFIGRNEEPYDFVIAEEIKPSTEWKLLSATGTAKTDFKKDSIKAEFQLGRAAQTVEFGPIYVTNASNP